MARKINITCNIPNWFCTESDYTLVFVPFEDGIYREASGNLIKFHNILLSDYLNYIGISVPDYTQFLRIKDYDRNLNFEYRVCGARVRVDVSPLEY